MLEALEFLIKRGGNVNAKDDNLQTAMHGAAYRNFPKVVVFLAESGANPKFWNHKNKYGTTPEMIAGGKRPGSFKPSPKTILDLQAALQTSRK